MITHVIRAEIATADDFMELVREWLLIASPYEREKLHAYLLGIADGLKSETATPAVAEENVNA